MNSREHDFSKQSLSMFRNDSWSGEKLPLNRRRACEPLSDSMKCEIRNQPKAGFLLEPTPIAPNRMKIVNQVDVSESRLVDHDVFFGSSLSPLLSQDDLVGLQSLFDQTSKLISNPSCVSIDSRDHAMTSHSKKSTFPDHVSSDDLSQKAAERRSRESHLEKWSQRFRDLVEFRKVQGHCLVPLEWPQNPSLAHWVKRQRCQYKAKMEGNHSTLSDERQEALEELGFIWDSHRAIWEERLNEIIAFKVVHGHANVPSKFPQNPQLSIWVRILLRLVSIVFIQCFISNARTLVLFCRSNVNAVNTSYSWNTRNPTCRLRG